jgi:hypothetical protein
MKSRVINTYRAMSQRPSLSFLRLSPTTGIALGGALCALTLSGCYYPAGYYPSAYYPSYYTAVPATATGQADPSDPQQQQQQQQQAQGMQQNAPPPTYAVAAPPVYVAPAYPAYYPPVYPPVYPAYYGYPGYYGPSVSIGIGGYWGGGGWGRHWH